MTHRCNSTAGSCRKTSRSAASGFARASESIGLIGAANRDPESFARPNTLDIGRDDRSHLSFGRGIHYCLGSSLAVLEGRIALAALLRRFSSIQLAAEPEHIDVVVLRGVRELWIDVERVTGA